MEPTSTPHFIVLNELIGNKPATLNAMQEWLAPHLGIMRHTWMAVACTVLVFVLLHLIREVREERVRQKGQE